MPHRRTRRVSLVRLLERIVAARRGDVRAMEDLYHLRSVLNFVGIFAATVALPGLLLAYYGIAGLRAEERAGDADVARQASAAADTVNGQVEDIFEMFEDSILNRMKSGQSLTNGLRQLSPHLRVVLRFDLEGNLVAPFARGDASGQGRIPEDAFFFTPFVAAREASRATDYARAATLWGSASRQALDPAARAFALFQRGNALIAAGDPAAESVLNEAATTYDAVRDPWGFRIGDLARLRLAERMLARDRASGEQSLRRDVEALLARTWVVGNGGEVAIARRALDLMAAPGANDWVAQARGALEDRSSQLYWAERLLPELDRLGARGLFRSSEVRFTYQLTDGAVWATTWLDDGQYVFALELSALVGEARTLAGRATGPDMDVAARVLGPGDAAPGEPLARQSLTAWMPGWTVDVVARDPDGLAERRTQERLRGSGIVLLSVTMIVLGSTLSARLVQRELDSARDKSDFAAHVSHELRSPITQIRLKAEALQLGLATDDEQVQRHYDVIAREAERLSRLVDNVLDFASIESGHKRYTFRPGDLGGTVRRAVESARVAMETRTMRIDLDLPEDLPAVWHDADAVAQVMHNLLSNAAKYGQEAGWIGVAVRAVEDTVSVAIADRGIGIAAAEQAHVFEQYWRSADPLARRRKGTGIGLTIVKYIMEAHGGRVALTSAPGAGSTFTLYFPIRPPSGAVDRAGA